MEWAEKTDKDSRSVECVRTMNSCWDPDLVSSFRGTLFSVCVCAQKTDRQEEKLCMCQRRKPDRDSLSV